MYPYMYTYRRKYPIISPKMNRGKCRRHCSHILVWVAKLQKLWSQPEPGGLKFGFPFDEGSLGVRLTPIFFDPRKHRKHRFFWFKNKNIGQTSRWMIKCTQKLSSLEVRSYPTWREHQSQSISKSAYTMCLVTTFLLKAMPTPHLHLRSSKVRCGCCDLFQLFFCCRFANTI